MLRVGLTGGLGSGKSTVGRMLAANGAHVLSSDEIGRELVMGRDAALRDEIAARFGGEVIRLDGSVDRAALARMAFDDGRVEELNAIVHPAVLARQEELIHELATTDPGGIVVVESALIFETKHGGQNGWRRRFNCIILVTAPEELRVERYMQRIPGAEGEASRRAHNEEARRRISFQLSDDQKSTMSDYVLTNGGTLEQLQSQVDSIWPLLQARARQTSSSDRFHP